MSLSEVKTLHSVYSTLPFCVRRREERPIFSSSQSVPTSAFMCDVEEGEVAINVLVTQCGRVIIHYIIIIVSVGELPLRGAVSFHFLEVEILFTFDTPALCLGEITGMGPLGSQK